MEFTEQDEKLYDDSPEEPYRVRDDSEKVGIAWGQRKLLLSLVSFLTNYLSRNHEKPIVVYAGAAPGINIGIAAYLFPHVTWHLYDPANFAISTDVSRRIFVYNKCFGDSEAEYWSKKDVYFISDIRTVDHDKSKDLTAHEQGILKDMWLQESWVETIRPICSQLKFRPPYNIKGVPNVIDYFEGIIYKTPWSPQSSTETRLVVPRDSKYVQYDCEKYQSQMFYHNNVIRKPGQYTSTLVKGDSKELVNDWDCCCELEIWKKYLSRQNLKMTPAQISEWATKLLNTCHSAKKQDTLSKLRANPRAIQKRNT